jgi:hypothetical protein
VSADGPEESPDLRHTEHEQRDVRVRRDLSAEGHLARGDHTRMSRLKFSARALPRDDGERDRVFVERDAASARAEVAPPDVATDAPGPAPAEAPDTLIQRVGKLFGL